MMKKWRTIGTLGGVSYALDVNGLWSRSCRVVKEVSDLTGFKYRMVVNLGKRFPKVEIQVYDNGYSDVDPMELRKIMNKIIKEVEV